MDKRIHGISVEIVRRVRSVAEPDRIILFGSAATGPMTPDSDVDLLVLMSDCPDRRKESVRLRRAIGDVGYPVDVLVMLTQRYEEEKDVIGGLAYPANKHGQVIYARS